MAANVRLAILCATLVVLTPVGFGKPQLAQSTWNTAPAVGSNSRQLLQISSRTSARYTLWQKGCELPEDATWAEVRLDDLTPFQMAVRSKDDILSSFITENAYWELKNMSAFGSPGTALDIGGNIGYYSFALAQAGWKVYTFEPMPSNIALIKATLCQNPSFADKVQLFEMGLGTENQECDMIEHPKYKGNGVVQCTLENEGEAKEQADAWGWTSSWVEQGEMAVTGKVPLHRLEEVLTENEISSVDFVKIDAEGYECAIISGAPSLLSNLHPRLVKTDVWSIMYNCTQRQYFEMFNGTGYKFGTEADPGCETEPTDYDFPQNTLSPPTEAEFYMCLK